MFIPKPKEQTIVIPVLVKKNGQLTLLHDDGELPPFLRDIVGELRVPAYALPEEWAQLFSAQAVIQLLPAEKELWVEVKTESLAERFWEHREKGNIREGVGKYFVKVILKEPLCLLWRSTKKATLLPCRCYIPALNEYADSLNEAYYRISVAFEPRRRSHTGNVFQLCYCDEKGLCSLDMLRGVKQAEYSKHLYQRLHALREKQRSQQRLL